ncbi:hypothetical protein ACQ4PT_007280 [Festuca glaucescens]
MVFRKDHPETMFISVVGESGNGKWSLASVLAGKLTKEFYNVIQFFAPPYMSTEELLLQIHGGVEHYCEDHKTACNQVVEASDIAGKIHYLLEKTKMQYLLILGGISSKTMLNCVRASLPDCNTRSSVLLVLDTENEEVAWHANTMNKGSIDKIHLVSRLDEQTSRKLFCSRVMRKNEVSADGNEAMSKYAKVVYAITGGHPLSIVLLAGLLRFKEKPLQWEVVLQQIMPGPGMEEAKDGEVSKTNPARAADLCSCRVDDLGERRDRKRESTAIGRVFWASFEDLPNDLKSCFLYFAVIPKSTLIEANEIVRMWIDEGFIGPQKGRTLEELGHHYLKELALRCLVRIGSTNTLGSIKKVGVHRGLHGFLQSEAGLIEVHDIHDAFVPPSARRLCFQTNGGRYTTFTNKFPKLRSFICMGNKEEDQITDSTGAEKDFYNLKFLLGSKFLRLLVVQGPRINELPKEIGNMLQMRQLSVYSRDLTKLPSGIKRLLNLQTLDIRNTRVEEIDAGFWKIKTLRHVLADDLTLPGTLQVEVAELQTLVGVKPAQEVEWEKHNCPLHKMTKLRTLKVHGIQNKKHGVELESALAKMHLLCRLKLKGDKLPSSVFTEDSLRHLQKITLDGTVVWPQGTLNIRKVRPNLVKVKLSHEVPDRIKRELPESV